MLVEITSIIGIVIGAAILVIGAWYRWSPLITAPLACIVTAAFAWMNPAVALATVFSKGVSVIVVGFALIYVFSCLFGKLLGDSGAATSIANGLIKLAGKKASKMVMLWMLVIITFLLSYGGINVFVIMFTMIPIMRPIFQRLNIPWHISILALIPGAFLACWLPGNPQIYQVIGMKFIPGAHPTITPALPIVPTAIFLFIFYIWARHSLAVAERKGENYLGSVGAVAVEEVRRVELPNVWLCIVPLVVLLVVFNVTRDLILALVVGCVLAYGLFIRRFKNIQKTVLDGVSMALFPLFCWAFVVGFGYTVSATAVFPMITKAFLGMPGGPVIGYTAAIQTMAGITGSASGGWTIILTTMGKKFIEMGLHPGYMHWAGVVNAFGFDTLPHNGVLFGIFAAFGYTHKEAYKHVFVTTVVATLLCIVPMILWAMALGCLYV